jgi:S-methylmethionine-dependent homocysteine/selenocysteine methylase
MSDFRLRLAARELFILDGAMGTELARRGAPTPLPAWSALALVKSPERVLAIHRDYVAAGADLLTTNTFRTTRRALKAAGIEVEPRELVALAAGLARRAAGEAGRPVYVLGSMAPLADCYRPDLAPSPEDMMNEHSELAGHLVEAGVAALLLETMNTEREALAALAAASATGLPVLASFVANEVGQLFDGTPLASFVPALLAGGANAVLVNCTPVAATDRVLPELAALAGSTPFGAYANIGYPHPTDGFTAGADPGPDEFAAHAALWVAAGASIIGGCCGTRPEHIAAIRARLRSGAEVARP